MPRSLDVTDRLIRLTAASSQRAVREYFKAWGAVMAAAAVGAGLGGYGAVLLAARLTERMSLGPLYLALTIALPVVGTAGGGVLLGWPVARLLARKGRLKG